MKIFCTMSQNKVNFKRMGRNPIPKMETIKKDSCNFFVNKNNIRSGYQTTGGGYNYYSLNDLKRIIADGREGLLERIASNLKSEARMEFKKAIETAKDMVRKGI